MVEGTDSVNIFENSINQWCYGGECTPLLPNKVLIGQKYCYYSNGTSMCLAHSGRAEIVLIGPCVDASGKWHKNEIAEKLSELDLDLFLVALESLCGVFVVIRHEYAAGVQIFGDATHMMSVYYAISGRRKGAVASCEAFLTDDVAKVSDVSLDIDKKGGDWQHAIMGDLTMYDDIRCLLPNHYLDLSNLNPVRYFPREELHIARSDKEINSIIDRVLDMIASSIQQFAEDMKFASPLTPGADSRLNCVLLKKLLSDKDIVYYQIKTHEMTSLPANLDYCMELASKMKLTGFVAYDNENVVDEETIVELFKQCGPIRSWGRRIWTYNRGLKDRVIVNGQIIDHVGKGYMKTWPAWMAIKWLMFVKFCNVSKYAYGPFGKWYDDARGGAKGYSLYDLLGWEIRCGRWSSNLISINSILGIKDINFYNCTRLLSFLCRIPRSKRARAIVHRRIIDKLMPEISDMPFNPYFPRSRHLPAWLNKIVPTIFQEFANYAIKVFKMR